MPLRPKNFRDVGESLGLWLDPSPIVPGRMLRGGAFDALTTAADLGSPRTILNLRRGPDPTHLEGVVLLHVPAADELENYDTTARRVRRWLAEALEALVTSTPPVYVHCTAGRDRTGIVVGAALVLGGVSHTIVEDEYMLSDGAARGAIEEALDGVIAHAREFDRDAIGRWLRGV